VAGNVALRCTDGGRDVDLRGLKLLANDFRRSSLTVFSFMTSILCAGSDDASDLVTIALVEYPESL
jgi:hypothetical protein